MELYRFTSRAINGVNLFIPPKFDFIFYEDRFEMLKKGKIVRTVFYNNITETQKIYGDFFINCKPIGIVIRNISDEQLNRIKEIIKK